MSIPCGPSALAVKEAAWGLARYASIAQVHIIVVIIIVNLFFCGQTCMISCVKHCFRIMAWCQ